MADFTATLIENESFVAKLEANPNVKAVLDLPVAIGGVIVKNLYLNELDHLIFVLANGIEVDAGYIKGNPFTFEDFTAEQLELLRGNDGAAGATGAPGIGIPEGGTTGQFLVKKTDDDFDTEWVGGGQISRYPIDLPTAASNQYDDEFNGSSLDAKWTKYGESSNHTITLIGGRLVLEGAVGASQRRLAVMQPVPSGPFTVRTSFAIESLSWNYFGIGLIAKRGTKSIWAGVMAHSNLGMYTGYVQRLDGETFSSEQDLCNWQAQGGYLELVYDETNLVFAISTTGTKFRKMYTEAISNFLGGSPEEIGIIAHCVDETGAGWGGLASFDWFRVKYTETDAQYPQTESGDYTNPDNVEAEDGNSAVISAGANESRTLVASGFVFDIPEGAVINGLTVEVRERADVPGYMGLRIQTRKNGSAIGTDLAYGPFAAGYGFTVRSKTDNGSWTLEELQSGALSVAVISDGFTFGVGYSHYIDYIRVAVQYTVE